MLASDLYDEDDYIRDYDSIYSIHPPFMKFQDLQKINARYADALKQAGRCRYRFGVVSSGSAGLCI